ncbi:hypothetical protein OsI_22022 [Oryza sativa Indica Group]|uniref:Uncharacterized protein n=1 Tax=Oryza sativa subsp. indica TaxID=39946 RepID=B8B3P4_ORYSI|nr:hypothetical protein OsI_22022 [Oryza sativa Indica Group]
MQGTVPSWQRCNLDLPYTRDIKSSIRYHLDLTTRGYRSLIYSGDHDMSIPFIGTQAWIRSLNFSVVDEWRPWFVDGQVGGYTRSYSNNLTFATVKVQDGKNYPRLPAVRVEDEETNVGELEHRSGAVDGGDEQPAIGDPGSPYHMQMRQFSSENR